VLEEARRTQSSKPERRGAYGRGGDQWIDVSDC
jgi:hypothetical protein